MLACNCALIIFLFYSWSLPWTTQVDDSGIVVPSQLKIPSIGGRVHWNDPHHPAHQRIGPFQACRSAVLHDFDLALHRSAAANHFFPHAVEKTSHGVRNGWFCGKRAKVCHAYVSPSPAPPSSAKRGFLLYAIQVKRRFNSTNELLLFSPCGRLYGLFHAGRINFIVFGLKL